MAAIKALELWCKTQCDGYEEVSITNMTTSFKNGLAFCAIIHKYRPDLIDFKALSKEDTFENNNLAFRIAEEKLGIPALLDAEDMVALRIPDRLSILTYVSQYYNYFKGRSPLGGVKRPAEGSKEEPSEKKNLPVVAKTFVSKTANCSTSKLIADTSSKTHRAAADKKTVLAESSNKTGTLNSKCAACKNHVHLVQRNFVEGRLYHRSCFKCSECSSVLHPGAYKAGKAPDTFICNTPCKPSSSGGAIGNGPIGAVLRRNGDSQTHPAPRPSSVLSIPPKNSVLKPVDPAPPPRSWTAAAQKTQTARQRFFQAAELVSEVPARNGLPSWPTDCSGRLKVPPSREQNCKTGATIGKTLAEENCNNNNTRHFVIRTAERRFGEEPRLSDNISLRQDKCQPGPVGKGAGHPSISHRNKESPCLDAINNNTTTKPTPGYWNSKDLGPNHWQSMLRPVKTEPGRRSPETDGLATTEPHELDLLSKPPWNILVSTTSTPTPIVSPPVSVAVAPAYHQDLSPQKPQPVSENMGLDHGNYYSTIKSPSSWSAMQSIGSSMTVPENDRDTKTCCPASKKGKYLSPTNAPSPEMRSPSAKSHHIPMDQIERELDEIETNLSNLEREGVGLEEKLRSFEQEEKGDILMDPLMVDWFNLIRKKQMYIRRESELVYIVKTQDLEEQQPSVEEELRRLLEKPDCLKSTEEQQRQQSLMERLVEIVNGRNAIVEGLDEDRLREVEEDQRLNEMMQNLRVKKSKTKRTSSISKLFRRRSKRVVE